MGFLGFFVVVCFVLFVFKASGASLVVNFEGKKLCNDIMTLEQVFVLGFEAVRK